MNNYRQNTEHLACLAVFLERMRFVLKSSGILQNKDQTLLTPEGEQRVKVQLIKKHFVKTRTVWRGPVSRDSELPVPGSIQEPYILDCRAVAIFLFWVTDPWQHLIIGNRIFLPPQNTQIYNKINISKQFQERTTYELLARISQLKQISTKAQGQSKAVFPLGIP